MRTNNFTVSTYLECSIRRVLVTIGLLCLSLSANADFKNWRIPEIRNWRIGVDETTPLEQLGVIRILGPEEMGHAKVQKCGTSVNAIEEYTASMNPPRWERSRMGGVWRGRLYVNPGHYKVQVQCNCKLLVYAAITVQAVPELERVIECVGTNHKTTQALVRTQRRDANSPGEQENAAPADLAGVWQMSLTSDLRSPINTLTLRQKGIGISGTLQMASGLARVVGTTHGNQVVFEARMVENNQKVFLEFLGQIEGDRIIGSMAYGDTRVSRGEWRADKLEHPQTLNESN
jgi:hypothetical protein